MTKLQGLVATIVQDSDSLKEELEVLSILHEEELEKLASVAQIEAKAQQPARAWGPLVLTKEEYMEIFTGAIDFAKKSIQGS